MSLPSLPGEAADQLDLLSVQLDELKAYLLSPELFWPLGGRLGDTPRLTLGNLLINLRTLQARSENLAPPLQNRLARLESSWQRSREEWAAAISKKALQEMGARLNLWRGYLEDLDEGLGNRLNYATEVRNRVLFELLASLPPKDEEYENLRKAMRSLDERFASVSSPAPFTWNSAYSKAFPKDRFPALYRKPTQPV
ncbi:MAG: hypothetical protein P8X64_13200 [Anaerolineales bacterium]|jgi:hypothetical protein